MHELLHLRVPNHGKVLKALMNLQVTNWKFHNLRRLDQPNPRRSLGIGEEW